MTRPRLRTLWPVAAAAIVAAGIELRGLHIIRTESGPVGLWQRIDNPAPRRGDVIRFCMRSDHAALVTGRAYAGGRLGGDCPHDTWVLQKPVLAVPGDTLTHAPEALTVNGRPVPFSATRTRDSDGRSVPVAPYGTYVLRSGEYWVYSPYTERSFDSRNLGVVTRHQLRGGARPVLIWLTSDQRAALRRRGLLPADRK